MGNDQYVLDRDSARRLGNVVRQAERVPRATAPGRSDPRILSLAKYAVVSVKIPAATTEKLGKGAGVLRVIRYDSAGKATRHTLPITVPIYSEASSEISAGRVVVVILIDGKYHVITDFC